MLLIASSADPADKALHLTAAFAGFAAYALMVGTVLGGVFMRTGLVRRAVRRETLYGGHMTMAIAALSFAVAHAAGNVFRPAADLSVAQALIPMLHTTAAVATGVVSLELAVVTSVSVWLQRRLGYRTWLTVHWLGYPAYGLAIVHTIMAGSDVRQLLVAILLAISALLVGSLVFIRMLPHRSGADARFVPLEVR